MHEYPTYSVMVLDYLFIYFRLEAFYQGVLKFYFFRNAIKNYLLLRDLVVLLEISYKYFLRKENYNLNMLSMYIFYILNPLVIDIKNIFQHYYIYGFSYNTKGKKYFCKNPLRQTFSELLWKTMISKFF